MLDDLCARLNALGHRAQAAIAPTPAAAFALARAVQPIDQVADAAGSAGLRIHLDRAETAASIANLLASIQGRARAPITICVPDPETGQEIDLALPQPYPVTPQVKGAIKAMQGVVMIEDL